MAQGEEAVREKGPTATEPAVRPQHCNNVGLLRFLFACLVIVAHSFELIDGGRRREPLTRWFGAGVPSLGEAAVLAFFVISGYLITSSFMSSKDLGEYLIKRAARIVPGYVVAFVLSSTVVAALAGADLAHVTGADLRHLFGNLIMLEPPDLPGVFVGLPYPLLNGSLWTISYEARCYLVVIAFALLGWHNRRKIYLCATIILGILAVGLDLGLVHVPGRITYWAIGHIFYSDPAWMTRFLSVFMVGACFRLFRDTIAYRTDLAAVSAACVLASLYAHVLPFMAIAVFGGYLIFWYGFAQPTSRAGRMTDKTDISYGTYLYGWPIGMVLLWTWRDIDPVVLVVATLALVLPIGWLSWHAVEGPALAVATRRWRRRRPVATMPRAADPAAAMAMTIGSRD